jgi:integrase
MYTDAINDGLVEHNPFSNMRAPQSKGRKHIKAPSAQEIAYFAQVAMLELDPVTGPQISSLILVGAYTGLRPGELLALDWDNVNFEEGLLHVRHTLDPFGEKKPPKNGKARTVVLPLIPVQALQSLPVQIDQRNVFANAHGGRLTKTSLYYYWNTVRAASGLKFTPHVLRHFCATYLIDEGAKNGMCTDFDASIQLGHTDGGRLVKELYGHPDEVRVRERVRAVLDAASGDSQVPDDEEWVANG